MTTTSVIEKLRTIKDWLKTRIVMIMKDGAGQVVKNWGEGAGGGGWRSYFDLSYMFYKKNRGRGAAILTYKYIFYSHKY